MVSRTVDSILQSSPDANILLMGDFNDTPFSAPLQNLGQLTNLAQKAKGAEGTYKYQQEWSVIDQILVSENLVKHAGKRMEIFAPEALLTEDATYIGIKPKRTYSGPRYLGGVSDHLPVLLQIFK